MLQCAPSFVLFAPGETESHLDCIRQEGEWHSLMPFIFPRAEESPGLTQRRGGMLRCYDVLDVRCRGSQGRGGINKRELHIVCCASHPPVSPLSLYSNYCFLWTKARHLHCIQITNILLFVSISVSPDISKSNLSFINCRVFVELDVLMQSHRDLVHGK